MKLGIVGSGMIAKQFLSIMGDLELPYVSICGRKQSEEKIAALAKEYQLSEYFLDYDKFLESEVDTIYIAIVNTLHYEYAKKALERGKNVILEKPATSSYEQLQELAELAEKKNLILVEAMTIPYLPAYKQLKQELDKAGNIRLAVFQYSQYSSRYDEFQKGIIRPAFDPKLDGGALMDINVYNIYAAVDLFGAPLRVGSYAANIQREIDTSGVVTLSYPGFQVVCVGAKDCSGSNRSLIQGEKGTFELHDAINGFEGYSFIDRANERKEFDNSFRKHKMLYEFFEFKRMVDDHSVEESNKRFEISLEVMKILDAARCL